MTRLTKSLFKMGLECPAKLFYAMRPQEFANASTGDSFIESLAEGGYQVGELAKRMFSDGVEVRSLGHSNQVEETNKLLALPEITIFEGAVAFGNLFARVDIIRKKGPSIELIEVKAKSYDPANTKFLSESSTVPYLRDIAFQRYVFSLAHPELASDIKCALLLPDKSRVATVDGLNQQFPILRQGGQILFARRAATSIGDPILTMVPVSMETQSIIAGDIEVPGYTGTFNDAIKFMSQRVETGQMALPPIGPHCSKCQFVSEGNEEPQKLRNGLHECWQMHGVSAADSRNGTVLDIWKFSRKADLIKSGKLRLKDVCREDISPTPKAIGLSQSERQWMQISGDLRGQSQFYIDRQLIADEMKTWVYPLHFIDFETSRVAVPFRLGDRPYSTIAFQFSHHVMNDDFSVSHSSQFLDCRPGFNPNLGFIRALIRSLGHDRGTVFMWSGHENTILKDLYGEIRKNPPNDVETLEPFLLSLTSDAKSGRVGGRAMYDLCRLAERAFFHPMTKGSSSIKKVLPAAMESSDWLRERYSQAIYGKGLQIPSLNFEAADPIVWWQRDRENIVNPYRKLPPIFPNLSSTTKDINALDPDTDLEVADGGGAMTAYGRLQFEALSPSMRSDIEAALLRYCELDTLAMVMVVEAWREWARHN